MEIMEYDIKADDKVFSFAGVRHDIISEFQEKNHKFYEEGDLVFLNRIIDSISRDNPMQIVDAGANIGNHSIWFAAHFPNATIHAFELNPVTYALLHRNISTNRLDNIKAYNIGLGEKECQCGMWMPPENLLGGARIDPNSQDKSATLKRLDDMRLENIKFIKIDVERSELPLLKGAINTIKANLPVIFCEIHTQEIMNAILALLKPLGYRIMRFNNFQRKNFLLIHVTLVYMLISTEEIYDMLEWSCKATLK